MTSLRRDAHAALFPVITSLSLDDRCLRFLDSGGCSILFGESPAEYASGRMSSERILEETSDRWQRLISNARARADGLLAAVDADISAVHRLHELTPPLPALAVAQAMLPEALEEVAYAVGQAAFHLGVNLVLSPTADVVTGPNPWLTGRTLGPDIETVSRMVVPYIRGLQRAGVAATLKHFPGHPTLTGHPAMEMATVPGGWDAMTPMLEPFRAGIAAGARAVMMGPAVFEATDPPVAGSISPQLMTLLRRELDFGGLVMTCDIDHPSTLLQDGVAATVVAALCAGADLVLLSPNAAKTMPSIVNAICKAVETGRLDRERLQAAAAAVRQLASRLHE